MALLSRSLRFPKTSFLFLSCAPTFAPSGRISPHLGTCGCSLPRTKVWYFEDCIHVRSEYVLDTPSQPSMLTSFQSHSSGSCYSLGVASTTSPCSLESSGRSILREPSCVGVLPVSQPCAYLDWWQYLCARRTMISLPVYFWPSPVARPYLPSELNVFVTNGSWLMSDDI